MSNTVLQVFRIPQGEVVVTRKVPMTEETCSKLRELQRLANEKKASELGLDVSDVKVELPCIIRDIVDEEYYQTFERKPK